MRAADGQARRRRKRVPLCRRQLCTAPQPRGGRGLRHESARSGQLQYNTECGDFQNFARSKCKLAVARGFFGLEKEFLAQALARAYLGDCARNRKLPRCTRFLAAAGFYSVVGLTGMFVLPVLAVLTVGMLACAVIAPVAGVIEFAGGLFGFDVPFVMMQFGRWTMPFWLTLPASLVLGALFLGAAYGLWRALRGYVRAVSRGKSALDAVKAG